MKIKLKLLTLVFCLLFCASLRAEDKSLCTTSAIDEIIKSKYKDDDKLIKLWSKLKTKNRAIVRGSDADVRPQAVNMQAVIETALASLLQDETLKYSKAVIYTPRPSTPLRADEHNLNTLVEKDFFEDKNRMQTITNRIVSVKEYLTKGGILYNIHKSVEATEDIPGMYVYNHNVTMHYNKLLDKPIKKIQKSYIGASYITECKDGTKVFFAIKGGESKDKKTKQWSLYYGDPNSKKLNKYFKKIQNIYKRTADVSFEFDDKRLY